MDSIDEVINLTGPKVVLASFPSLDYGLGRDLLLEWANQPRNCICFVERPPFGSLGYENGKLTISYLLYEKWLQGGSDNQKVALNQDIALKVFSSLISGVQASCS